MTTTTTLKQPDGNPSGTQEPSRGFASTLKWAGVPCGPIAAALVYFLLPEVYADASGVEVVLGTPGRATAALAAWMAIWWMTEATNITVTALLPIAILPLLGARTIQEATGAYGHPLILLFLGGFMIAISMERWGLHRRIALSILRLVGSRTRNIVAGFMLVTALLSMWVSNTASVLMMIPIAMSVIDLAAARAPGKNRNFGVCLMLGIAYAASIGGVGSLIGSPPNLFLVSHLRDTLGIEITFAQWFMVGLPVVIVFLPITWLLLTRVLYPIQLERVEGGSELIEKAYRELGPMNRGEKVTLAVFLLAAGSWVSRSWLSGITIVGITPFSGLTDAGIAILAAIALFLIPVNVGKREFVMNWEACRKLPWGILFLLGGGLSLAGALKDNGVGEFIGSSATIFKGFPEIALVLVVVGAVIFLTEVTSNTATTATLVPILVGIAPVLGTSPLLLAIPATIAASCAFMLPVATPPNALVYGSGRIAMGEMVRAGIWLNLTGILVVTGLAYFLILPLLG